MFVKYLLVCISETGWGKGRAEAAGPVGEITVTAHGLLSTTVTVDLKGMATLERAR